MTPAAQPDLMALAEAWVACHASWTEFGGAEWRKRAEAAEAAFRAEADRLVKENERLEMEVAIGVDIAKRWKRCLEIGDQLIKDKEDLTSRLDRLRKAGELALEYWRHRQQRYKNRRPAWVEVMQAALTDAGKPADMTEGGEE